MTLRSPHEILRDTPNEREISQALARCIDRSMLPNRMLRSPVIRSDEYRYQGNDRIHVSDLSFYDPSTESWVGTCCLDPRLPISWAITLGEGFSYLPTRGFHRCASCDRTLVSVKDLPQHLRDRSDLAIGQIDRSSYASIGRPVHGRRVARIHRPINLRPVPIGSFDTADPQYLADSQTRLVGRYVARKIRDISANTYLPSRYRGSRVTAKPRSRTRARDRVRLRVDHCIRSADQEAQRIHDQRYRWKTVARSAEYLDSLAQAFRAASNATKRADVRKEAYRYASEIGVSWNSLKSQFQRKGGNT